MGFTIYYRSTRPVTAADVEAVERANHKLCDGHTWLSCEPVGFFPGQQDGHLFGGSKPNFTPDAGDAAAAASEGLPDGTTRDMLRVLCQLSQKCGIDWEISHDYSDGPIGYIRDGICDSEVLTQVEGLAELGDVLADLTDGSESHMDSFPSSGVVPGPNGDSEDDDGPATLPFRSNGE
jgi:hypothetical protein